MDSKRNSAVAEFLPLPERIKIADVVAKSVLMSAMAKDLRDRMLEPKPRKNAPVFTLSEVAEICGIDRHRAAYLLNKDDSTLPKGKLEGKLREFSLEELFAWVEEVKDIGKPPENKRAATILFGNYKGGSTKTTTAMCVAQGLTMRGRKVLLVDLDPQGSLTELCGFYSDLDVKESSTVASYISAYLDKAEIPADGLSGCVTETYWKNIDLIASSTKMFGAEFNFPQIISKYPDVEIWKILTKGLDPLRGAYDYLILDTAPSLSYMTVNAIMAADSLFMPLVPDGLDFISSIQFWTLFEDLEELLMEGDEKKSFDLVHVLLSMVDNSRPSVEIVRRWAKRAYGDWVLNTEIPFSTAASTGALTFSTVFDMSKENSVLTKKTIDRLKLPFIDICENIDNFYLQKWSQK